MEDTSNVENEGQDTAAAEPVHEEAAEVPTEKTDSASAVAAALQTRIKPRGSRKERVGLVVSDKMDKTITVAVYGWKMHPLYKKRMKHTRKFKAHDEQNTCNAGDLVRIRESRPLSKTKRWRLVEIVKRAE
ncbi:MAG: 30S ribosomal protein S17 [Candidatus Hydrogenedens sp.]|nr:30S ribosomal protein S17 [Candidatus Hydrogenedens sp.]